MWKTVGIIVGTLALMVVSGFVTFAVAVISQMSLGLELHGNYMYYDNSSPALVWGPAVIGFLAPGVVVWYLHNRKTRKGRSR